MVFTGIPVFLDPPNWQQDHHGHGGGNGNGHGHGVGGGSTHMADNSPLSNMLHPSTQEMISAGVNSGLTPSSRPTLMADRARLAKIQPDMSLKCPRCDSNNTKFCYYNNYSLSQPRHFCKTCRRYWTKGGALRNVPVGGGCRRNKRNKSGGSNSNSSRSAAMDTTSSGSATMISTSNCTADQLLGIDNNPANQSTMHHHHILPFMPAIHSLSDYSVNVTGGGGGTDHHIGLTNFPSGRDFMSLTGGGGAASALGLDFSVGNEPVDQGQWRMQQHYSLMTLPPPQPRAESSGGGHQLLSMEPQALFPYEGDHHNNNHHQGLVEQPYMPVSAGIAAQLQLRAKPAGLIGNLCVNTAPSSSVMKMEGDHHQINHNNNPSQNLAFWTSNAWADFAANFPSTTSPLL